MPKNTASVSTYLPHIDGLRAIAVMAVLLFHADIDKDLGVFNGGFVGVDIFFTISGFLITRMILSALEEGSFSLMEFYARRARRLFPALIATIALCFLTGVLIFTPDELERLGGSTLNATLSLSNFYFWLESGYFDAAAYSKPLLHTWSLGVEEQFYLIWPFLLLLSFRFLSRRTLFIFMALVFAGSLVSSELLLSRAPAAAFYLTPFRVFEFAIGALVYLLRHRLKTLPVIESICCVAGLVLIIFSVATFDETTRFPGLNALVPVTGVALLLHYGSQGVTGHMLTAAPARFLGKISYSLYLVHWPIIVFFPRVFRGKISDLEEVLLVLCSIVVAAAMHRWIETPFRSPDSKAHLSKAGFGLVCALCAALIIAPAASSWAANGWSWRFGQRAAVDLDELRRATLDIAFAETGSISFDGHPEAEKILVIGDSHSVDTANALHLTLPRHKYDVKFLQYDDECLLTGKLRQEKLSEVKQKKCDRVLEVLKSSPKTWYADTVVFSNLWSEDTAEKIAFYQEVIEQKSLTESKRYIVLGVGEVYSSFFADGLLMLRRGESLIRINKTAFKLRNSKNAAIDEVLRTRAEASGMEFFSKHAAMCIGGSCDFVLSDGQLALYDSSHWTLAGAVLFGSRLAPEIFPNFSEE